MIMSFNGKHPQIGPDVFIAPTAVVIGDVSIGEGSSIWYGTVLRGDTEPIVIGRYTSIQDNSTLHSDHGFPTIVGSEVTVGHHALVHGCTIEDGCLIGNGAQVLNGAAVRTGSVVAAGSIVREGVEIGPGQLAAGLPAVVKRALTETDRARLRRAIDLYRDLARRHREAAAALGRECDPHV
jgi:carbonic anhydrase/acetyltransferase-like protein (isoleucine patch superfamily)